MKAKKLQKKPKNSVWDVLQSSLLSYCNIKSIAPLGSYLGVFPWTTLTNPTFLLRKPSEVGVKRHYFQHFALKSINQHKQSRAKHSSPWDLLHPTAATDTRHIKRLPSEPIKGSECPETSLVQPTTGWKHWHVPSIHEGSFSLNHQVHPNTVFLITEMKLEAKAISSFKICTTRSLCGTEFQSS